MDRYYHTLSHILLLSSNVNKHQLLSGDGSLWIVIIPLHPYQHYVCLHQMTADVCLHLMDRKQMFVYIVMDRYSSLWTVMDLLKTFRFCGRLVKSPSTTSRWTTIGGVTNISFRRFINGLQRPLLALATFGTRKQSYSTERCTQENRVHDPLVARVFQTRLLQFLIIAGTSRYKWST